MSFSSFIFNCLRLILILGIVSLVGCGSPPSGDGGTEFFSETYEFFEPDSTEDQEEVPDLSDSGSVDFRDDYEADGDNNDGENPDIDDSTDLPEGDPVEDSQDEDSLEEEANEIDLVHDRGDEEPQRQVVPGINEVIPNFGSTSGGSTIHIMGSDFTPDSEVFFGPFLSPMVRFVSASELECITPQAEEGEVDVRVLNEFGVATLPSGFSYVSEIEISGLEPAESPTDGGVPITIRGAGFLPESNVSFQGRDAIDCIVENESLISALTPPGVAGPADLRITNSRGTLLIQEALFYYEPIQINQVFPNGGSVEGGQTVEITGRGFGTEVQVLFGERSALVVNQEPNLISVLTPTHSPGPQDITVIGNHGGYTLPDGYTYYEVIPPELHITEVYPSSGPTSGGTDIVILGTGFQVPDLQVFVGGLELTEIVVTPNSLRGLTPAGELGPVDILVQSGDEQAILEDGFSYYADLFIDQVLPNSGPRSGGTRVTLEGTGFSSDTAVMFGPLVSLETELENPERLIAVTPPGSGLVEIRVERGPAIASLPEGFHYVDELAFLSLIPLRGSLAGGTSVVLSGRGFSQEMLVTFDGAECTDLLILDSTTASCNTPPHSAGEAEVQVILENQHIPSPELFTYFNPTSRYGGAWGEAIQGSVNVSVLEYPAGTGVEGAFVMLTTDPETIYQGVTDADGLVTISGDRLFGRQTITASKTGYDTNSVVTVDAENISVYLQLQSQGNGTPPTIPLGRIFGQITGVDKVEDITEGEQVEMAVVFTTQEDPWTPNPSPGSGNTTIGNGGYELISRIGDVAVVGMCGVYDIQSGNFIPHFMAIRRFLFLTGEPGEEFEVDLYCDIPLEQQLSFRFVDPPRDPFGPNINRVTVYLDFGLEGMFGGVMYGAGVEDIIIVEHLPLLEGALEGMSFKILGGAYTDRNPPYSLTVVNDVENTDEPITLAPLIGMPRLLDPTSGGRIANRHIEWEMSNQVEPDMFVVLFTTMGFPPMTLWTLYLPGSSREFVLPQMPLDAETGDFPPGAYQITFWSVDIAGDFDFDEFNYNHLGYSVWKSWSATAYIVIF